MSVLCDMLTRRCSMIAAPAIGKIPPMPNLTRERLWRRNVDPVRVLRKPEDEIAMATTTPKKPALQNAAANSYSKAGADMKQAEPPLSQPGASLAKPVKADRGDDKGRNHR
jgi:hypothetical protein